MNSVSLDAGGAGVSLTRRLGRITLPRPKSSRLISVSPDAYRAGSVSPEGRGINSASPDALRAGSVSPEG